MRSIMGRFGLLLILVGLIFQEIAATAVDVNEGKLSDVKQLDALATIAGQSYGDALLEMLNGTDGSWHPMSFWRFMILAAPPNKESLNLTKENELLKNVSQMGGLSATKRSAVAVYQSTHHVKEVGTVNIKAWSLVYSCISRQCTALVPAFILQSEKKSKPEYVSLFRGLFTSPNSPYFASAVSADLANLQAYNDIKDGLTFQMPKKVQECTPNSLLAARSVLGASYGLPGFFCYNTSSSLKTSLRVLSNEQALDNKTIYGGDGSIEWPKCPIEECSAAPFLYGGYDSYGSYYIMACASNATTSNSYYCVTVTNVVEGCSYSTTIDAMYEKLMTSPDSTTCGIENNVHKASYYINVVSRWEASDGKLSEEFKEGQPAGEFCYEKISSTEAAKPISCSDANSDTSRSSRCDPTYFSADLLGAMLKDTADSFLSGHVTQFNVKKGPYGSRLDAAALSMATFIGLVSLVGPLTRGEIRLFSKWFKCFSKLFDSSCDEEAQSSNSSPKPLGWVCLCVLNVGLGCVVYGPIITAMRNQYDKRLPFHTWAVSATSETVNTYGSKMLFLTFVEGSSTYFSLLIWGCYILACVLALLITARITYHTYFHAPDPAQVYRDSHSKSLHRYTSMVTRK